MKRVVIFGAAGRTGRIITEKILELPDTAVSVFVRDPDKLSPQVRRQANVIRGDALHAADTARAMAGQDILLCSLEGDVLTMARNIVRALERSGVRRIVWLTGMGIHREIGGPRGALLARYAAARPAYVEAADTIAACSAATTLLRCPEIRDGDNSSYYLTKEGMPPRPLPVDRAGIAQCMADIVVFEDMGVNDSLGITN